MQKAIPSQKSSLLLDGLQAGKTSYWKHL